MRIVSLVPSATEILCAVGGESHLVGRSHECDFPPSITHLPTLTAPRIHATSSAQIDEAVRATLANGSSSAASLYELDAQLLRALKPDLILTQDLCDVCSIDLHTVRQVASELQPQPAILCLNPQTLEDVFDDLLRVGAATNLHASAERAVVALRERYWSARDFVNAYIPGPEVAFLEWMEPMYCAGHWTPQLISDAGGAHSLNTAGAKSRKISPEELIERMPEHLIICPCGFDLEAITRELHVLTAQHWWKLLPAVQHDRVALVDGNQMFNRPGPRLIDAYCWLVAWLNDRPEVMPPHFPWRPYNSTI